MERKTIFRGQKTFVPANNALPRKCQEINWSKIIVTGFRITWKYQVCLSSTVIWTVNNSEKYPARLISLTLFFDEENKNSSGKLFKFAWTLHNKIVSGSIQKLKQNIWLSLIYSRTILWLTAVWVLESRRVGFLQTQSIVLISQALTARDPISDKLYTLVMNNWCLLSKYRRERKIYLSCFLINDIKGV